MLGRKHRDVHERFGNNKKNKNENIKTLTYKMKFDNVRYKASSLSNLAERTSQMQMQELH